MTTPVWALSIAYWLHMLATIIWIGSLGALSLFVLPSAREILGTKDYAALLSRIQKKFNPLAWFSLIVLIATGLVQMSTNPNYKGFLAIEDRWAAAILVKHILFGGMTLLSAYMTWILLPRLQRTVLMQSRKVESSVTEVEIKMLYKQELLLMRLNLILGVIILALTAIARTT